MRSISRITGVSINTVTKLLIDAGEACAAFHYGAVRGVKAKRVQCDEIWSFCYAKERNVATAKTPSVDAGRRPVEHSRAFDLPPRWQTEPIRPRKPTKPGA